MQIYPRIVFRDGTFPGEEIFVDHQLCNKFFVLCNIPIHQKLPDSSTHELHEMM
jgi:hypothetical protein